MTDTETQTADKPVKPGMKGGRSNHDINSELRAKAARQAALKRAAEAKTATAARAELEKGELHAVPAQDEVMVRVLKLGDNKISMGVHVGGIGEAHYEKGDEFIVARDIATDLEDRGYVEIQ